MVKQSIVFVLALCGSIAIAKTLSLEEVRKLQQDLKGRDQVTVDFRESIERIKFSRISVSSGRAYFASSGKFRLSYQHPVEREVIYNGKEAISYNVREKTVIDSKGSALEFENYKQIVDLFLNLDSLSERFDLIKAGEKAGVVDLRLRLKTKSPPPDEKHAQMVDVKILVPQNFITGVVYNDKSTIIYKYELANPDYKPLAKGIFDFVPPPDAKYPLRALRP